MSPPKAPKKRSKKSSASKPEKVRKRVAPLKADGAKETLHVLDEPIEGEVAEILDFSKGIIHDEVISQVLSSSRDAEHKPALINTQPGIPQKSQEEEDPYALERLSITRTLTPEVIRKLALAVECGSDVWTACNRYLICRTSVLKWRRIGDSLLNEEREPENDHELLCLKFTLAMMRASGRYETKLDEGIHSESGFMRFLTIAKLRHPQLYGEQAKENLEEFMPDEAFA